MFTTACSPKQHAWNPWRHKCCMRGLSMDSFAIISQWCRDKYRSSLQQLSPHTQCLFPLHRLSVYTALTGLCCLSVWLYQQRPSRDRTMLITLHPGSTSTHCVPTTTWTSSSPASSASMWSLCLLSISGSLRWVYEHFESRYVWSSDLQLYKAAFNHLKPKV